MVWIVGASVIAEVAACAVRRRARKTSVDVTGGTIHADVRPAELKFGGIVIEGGALPRCCVVAAAAVVGKTSGDVIRIAGRRVVLRVAAVAFRRRTLEAIAGMTVGAA